jgi:hypothetical protein
VCQARLFEPLSLFFFFLSGGPGLAGWILYRSASLVVDACCNNLLPKRVQLIFTVFKKKRRSVRIDGNTFIFTEKP